MQAASGSVQALKPSSETPSPEAVAGAERVRELAPAPHPGAQERIVAPKGTPGPAIPWPSAKAPKEVLRPLMTSEARPSIVSGLELPVAAWSRVRT